MILYLHTIFTDVWSPLFWVSLVLIYLQSGLIVKGQGYTDCMSFDDRTFPNRIHNLKKGLLVKGGTGLKMIEYQVVPYLIIASLF